MYVCLSKLFRENYNRYQKSVNKDPPVKLLYLPKKIIRPLKFPTVPEIGMGKYSLSRFKESNISKES
jgi:hypothetical protein